MPSHYDELLSSYSPFLQSLVKSSLAGDTAGTLGTFGGLGRKNRSTADSLYGGGGTSPLASLVSDTAPTAEVDRQGEDTLNPLTGQKLFNLPPISGDSDKEISSEQVTFSDIADQNLSGGDSGGGETPTKTAAELGTIGQTLLDLGVDEETAAAYDQYGQSQAGYSTTIFDPSRRRMEVIVPPGTSLEQANFLDYLGQVYQK